MAKPIGGGLSWKGAATIVPDLSAGDYAIPDGQYLGAVVGKDADLISGNVSNGVNIYQVVGSAAPTFDALGYNAAASKAPSNFTLYTDASALASSASNVLAATAAFFNDATSGTVRLEIDSVSYKTAFDVSAGAPIDNNAVGIMTHYLTNVAGGSHTVRAYHNSSFEGNKGVGATIFIVRD